MRSIVSFAVVATTMALLALQVDAAAKLRVFKEYPLLQCSGCEIMAHEIGRRMNITAADRGHQTYTKSIKKEKTNYIGSEAQAVDVLELFCQDIRKNAKFIVNEGNMRIFEHVSGSSPAAEFYTQREEDALLVNPTEQLEDMCEEILDNYEDVIVRAIKRNRRLDGVVNNMCLNGMKLCEKDYLQEGMRKERKRYDAWVERGKKKEPRRGRGSTPSKSKKTDDKTQ